MMARFPFAFNNFLRFCYDFYDDTTLRFVFNNSGRCGLQKSFGIQHRHDPALDGSICHWLAFNINFQHLSRAQHSNGGFDIGIYLR